MFREICNDKTNVSSQLIFCLFLEQFEDFLPTYNANGEIEVWRNTLPRLVCNTRIQGYVIHVYRDM